MMEHKPSYKALEQRIRDLESELRGAKKIRQQLDDCAVPLRFVDQQASIISQNRMYRTLIDSIPDFIARFDQQARHLYVNSSVTRTFGVPLEQIVGKTLRELPSAGSPMQVETLISKVKEVFDRGAPTTAEACWVTPKGERVVEIRHIPEFDQQGKVATVLGITRDITARKQAEKEQQQLRQQFTNALETAHLGHWEYDVKTDCFTFNDQFYKIYRTTAEQVGGYQMSCRQYTRRFVHPKDMGLFEAEIRKAAAASDLKASDQLEHRILYADGGVGYINVRYFVVRDENGNTVKTYGVNQDVSDSKNRERQFQQAQKMESIGILAGGIAHDFNNILSSIIGFTELALEETPSGTALEDNLQEVYSAGQRARELVAQILTFARQSDEKKSPIPPSAVASEVLKFIRSTIPTTIAIQQEIKSGALIMGNATQVYQLLMNLCTNAAQSMEDAGGVLKVSMKDVVFDAKVSAIDIGLGPYVEIKVSDTGVGISPDVMDSIFDPYFTTKSPGVGTGMGLAVVHGIVESCRGKISVDSQLGKGTTFTIHLPVTRKRADLHVEKCGLAPMGQERILFVDDEAPITKMGGQILGRLGYSVITKTSSIDALALFKAKPDDFDLVVTDMTMPHMTGDKLAIELMKIKHDIPVILCTGYSQKISNDTASKIGAKAIIYKPIVKVDLAKIVRNVLDETKVGIRQ
jgi:PAS domain S-box-containing protein